MRRKALIASLLTGAVLTTLTMTGADARGREADVARAFTNAGLATPWQRVAKIPLKFPTHHPQGFALVGDLIFMSTVEVTEAPVKYPMPVDGYDRSPGKGQGHVLVLDRTGKQFADIKVGEATMYHPGGIDFGGIALLDLADDNRILKEQPFPAYGSTGHIATRNPLAFEVDGSKMRILAAPDDGDSPAGTELLIYEAPLPA